MQKYRFVYRNLLFYLIILILLCTPILSSCNLFDKREKALEYLSQFEHSGEIVYVDNAYIYINDQKIDFRNDGICGYDVSDILYVTETSIYFYTYQNKQVNIYVCDYGFEKAEEIHSFKIKDIVLDLRMYSDKEIEYEDESGKHIYCLETNTVKDVEEFPTIKKKYSAKVCTSVIFGETYIEIQDLETQEIKKVSYSQILEVEQAKVINDITGGLGIDYAKVHNGKIYLCCTSSFITITIAYDFEMGDLEFLDWSEAIGTVSMYILEK